MAIVSGSTIPAFRGHVTLHSIVFGSGVFYVGDYFSSEILVYKLLPVLAGQWREAIENSDWTTEKLRFDSS
jgi:hypothetical protein